MDLKGKKGIVFGVANDRSIAWAIAKKLDENGARVGLASVSYTHLTLPTKRIV